MKADRSGGSLLIPAQPREFPSEDERLQGGDGKSGSTTGQARCTEREPGPGAPVTQGLKSGLSPCARLRFSVPLLEIRGRDG